MNLSDKIQKIVKDIGMKRAEEEQNLILKKYCLTALNKEQIQGVADLISYVNKMHTDHFKEFIKKVLKRLGELPYPDAINYFMVKRIMEEVEEGN